MTLPYGDDDIGFMLRDVGVPVTVGSVNDFGILNKQDKAITKDEQGGEVHVHIPSVSVQVSKFPDGALDIDQAITVDGVNYVIRDHEASEDGALLKLWLRKA